MIGDRNGRYRIPTPPSPRNSSKRANKPHVGTNAKKRASRTTSRTTESAGIRAGEIIGYRAWWYVEDKNGPYLLSIFNDDVVWRGNADMPRAEYFYTGGGYHAFKTFGHTKRQFRWYGYMNPTNANSDIIVIGQVSMWGVVYEHKKGYRAEYVKPVSFDAVYGPNNHWWHFGRNRKLLEGLRKQFNIKK